MLIMGALFFSVPAYAADDPLENLTVDAVWLEGDMLHIEVTDKLTGINQTLQMPSASQSSHYHQSRYHFCNLHSFFNGHGTIALRGFNSELHAGKIRSYIVLALALNHQALTQNCASSIKPQVENEKFAMRVYLNRIGFIGKEFKNCREHLCCHLSGNSAWRYRVALT